MVPSPEELKNPSPVRHGCLALILNQANAVLMVRPTAKDGGCYQLPGGTAWKNEPPWEAVRREVREETRLDVRPRRLLVLDWTAAQPDQDIAAGINFVFWCGRVPNHTPITLPKPRGLKKSELDDYRWVRVIDLDSCCAPYQVRRVRAALQARARGILMELHEGHPTRPP
ncbi:NUDIX domain-containing protein [Streptomyces iconiensis]|uniref:NUDIX hydrolase n=1 Tax=Streptomyces iconiensis TaxID=1384038 RepID=A0ABT7A4K9_9ACTN|nr:NUDIX hydrolase [Streptomyces iconiensis]MDJ1136278.1 NUDIX hydrolase [Streptomyces iconiensis]